MKKLEAPAFGHVIKEPVCCIEMENFNAIVIEQTSKPMKVNAITYKDRVIFGRHETIVVFVNDVDTIAQIDEGFSDLPRFPSVGMPCKIRVLAPREEGIVVIAEQNVSD